MSMAAALVMIAQAGAPLAVADRAPIVETATATVRILRPVRVRFSRDEITIAADAAPPQRNRDAAGRSWVEFS